MLDVELLMWGIGGGVAVLVIAWVTLEPFTHDD